MRSWTDPSPQARQANRWSSSSDLAATAYHSNTVVFTTQARALGVVGWFPLVATMGRPGWE